MNVLIVLFLGGFVKSSSSMSNFPGSSLVHMCIFIYIATYSNTVFFKNNPDSQVCVAHMRPTWVLSAPGGPHVGPTNVAIRDIFQDKLNFKTLLESKPLTLLGNGL